ncbi:hypothetical protein ABZX65_26505 [Streptomyces sp. NPDC003300]|uniref:hypothetical protein n=1 Tax=unclassified Streptomyces TaxID=2593676 RepID=UPI0033B49D92
MIEHDGTPQLSRLDKLRVTEEWLAWALGRVRMQIAAAEHEQARATQEAATAERRARALAGWTVERRWQGQRVHHGSCLRRDDDNSHPLAGHEQARALVDSGNAEACPECAGPVLDAPA